MKLTGIRWNRRTAGIGAAIVATAVAGTASLAAADFGEDRAVWGEGAGPVSTALHTVAFPAANGREVTIPRRDTERFAMVGVTWANPSVDFKGAVAVRTHAVDGKWSGWRPLELDNHFGPEPGARATAGKARGGTDPLWVGQSDGVEVRATAAGGGTSDQLPAGLRLELVDPGLTKRSKAGAAGIGHVRPERLQPVAEVRALEPTPTDPAPTDTTPTDPPTATVPAETTAPAPTETTVPPAATTAPAPTTTSAPAPTTSAPTVAPTATAPANPVPTPKVVTRPDWKADESIVTDPPTYGTTVKAFFVHHTAGTNDYSCADSAAIVRGIEVYHVKSNGWNDIGYNFLVDKCGVVFEGRKGGIDKPVTGAHTYGFNTDNAAIAVLGTYIDTGIPTVVQDAVAHVAAYKLGQYGNDPLDKVTLTSGVESKYHLGEQVVFNRISGHRDAVATECPGDALYGQLAVLRSKAASVYGLALTGLTGTKNGTTYYTKNTVTASWSVSTPSTLISRFEVLVDGAVVATTAGTARSAALTVTPGSHTVQVRGVHVLGRTAATPAQTVVADTVAPTFPQVPTLSLRTGGVSSTVVPVTLGWRSADNVAVRSVSLTAPTTGTFAASGASGTTTKPGVTTTWSMRADDWSGNTATASAAWTPSFIPESKATRTGTWTTYTNSNYLGGSALTATAGKASLSWVFTGRSVAFVATTTSTSGQAEVWIDGVKTATVDLRSSTTQFRRIVWAKSWTGSARHTIKIVVVGTSGRPRVIADSPVYVR
ncbi:N-acetylmuramoyl-L-alanine amidase [Micromonospora sp. RTP1Z1]|uniref:N-acetylmuramoyl-L-alanine amidase n=1 Tax=Micromonospora sp. RTP1Z1 TaxID=2994043 RepID=UPI0029C6B320|nr:N-acetylmuramoyl-L-alanine amidase [Micromonospora sp. RTP1Z1]